jgi:hypothetical protein
MMRRKCGILRLKNLRMNIRLFKKLGYDMLIILKKLKNTIFFVL